MIPSVLSAQLRQGVEDFLKTTFPISTPFFHGIVDRLLEKEESVFQGPFLELQLPFQMGSAQADHFPDITLPFTPYLHQERAFERLCGPKPRSTIVATGTGSGKTECFLYPILDYCHRQRGVPGIKAILIYPMNALATDQAGRIARMIYGDANLKGNVTAGLFVGQSEKDPHMGMTADFIISHKDTLRHGPPDILLTNYKMLDYLLIRAKDYPLWQHNQPETLRYLVVDELHTFDGAQGTDLACLLRRLKARLATPENYLCCVGTSATLGKKSEQERLTAYAAEIFGELMDADGIISEYRMSAGTFLEKSLISRVDIVPLDKAARLDPEGYPDFSTYIRAQHELWLGETIDADDPSWRVDLCERLKSHLFFQNLLKVLGGRVRGVGEILFELTRVTPEFKSAPPDYQRLILTSMVALVSSALEEKNGRRSPFLNVRFHLWLRELRRMVGKVTKDPELRFADDLNEEQLKRHLPVIHCRECGSMGWAGVKRQQDNKVITDLATFYHAFFRDDPKVVFIFPEDAQPQAIQAEGQFYRLCSQCIRLSTRLADGDCENCGKTDMLRVFIPNTRVTRGNRQVGLHHCPYCRAHNGLTILGSRAASLTSVLIAQLYASTYNDDKKLLAFSDSVQDAAHRAGFFTGRTFRFNLRGAIQQYVKDKGRGLALDRLPDGFIDYWQPEMGDATFIATFLPPDMAWMTDYEELKKTGRVPTDSTLLKDIKRRIAWEIYTEYGFRCRIGRSLEKTGCSIAGPDEDRLAEAVTDCLDILRNEIGALRDLDTERLERFVLGMLAHLRHQGGVHHPLLSGYIENHGKTYLLNKIPWMPGFGMSARAPAFLSLKRISRFDPLLGSRAGRPTWYESWAGKCFDPLSPLVTPQIAPIYDIVLKALTGAGLLVETRVRDNRIWGIAPQALVISDDVVQLRCRACGYELSAPAANQRLWAGAPCLRFHCTGVYETLAPVQDYYGKLYTSGDIERIFAAEHTGLLDRDTRESLEACFKKKDRAPWDPNLLSCTPTLEMGIDIGNLSSVILCCVPPAQAHYLQRIGRAGRRDGNALNLTVANARPHDLYFFSEPNEMLAGDLDPPGVFLDASAVLERQFTAFCMDRWVQTGISESAIPLQLRHVLGNLEKVNPEKFPHNFLAFIETHRTDLFDRFIDIFSSSLSQEAVSHLRRFVEGHRDQDGSLAYRIVDGLYFHFKDRESLKKKANTLSGKIREFRKHPAKDQQYEKDLEDLLREKNALQALVTRINDRHTLNFFTDEGLIPNYAFPEAGVLLRSLIYRKRKTPSESEGKYDTFSFDYERPAVSAISELAPDNNFYAGGRKVQVDQVDLTVSEIETWRFCAVCACHQLVAGAPETSTCPLCGGAMWADAGQKRQMIRMRQVFATTPDRTSRISDDSDDRDPSFYNKQMFVGYRDEDITSAFVIDNDELPFGIEFLKRVTLREVNFGEKGDEIDRSKIFTIAGVESPRKGFVICRYCGKVQNQKNEIQHTLWCGSRKKTSENNLTECVYLYREFASEAIMMLLPVTTFEGSDKKLHSFIAALHLGLKKKFSGNIDHLQTAVHEEPVPNSNHRKKYLVLYDTVPGGTGYLKQLMRSAQPVLDVFEKALDVLKSCACNQDPGRDGCYQCLFAYRRSYTMAGTSREIAKNMLADILSHKDEMIPTTSLKGVRVNVLFDSELEARFIEALRRVRLSDKPALLKKEVVGGKPGYYYKLGEQAYYIELQVPLGPADGVAVWSKADFFFRPARIKPGRKPVVVFTDGFFYHRDRVGDDMAQRCAIIQSGNFHVWSLSWKDLENRYRYQGNYYHNHLNLDDPSKTRKYNLLLETYGVDKLGGLETTDSFDWLVRYLNHPDEKRWCLHAFVHGLLHLDPQYSATEETRKGWLEKLQDYFPDEVAMQAEEILQPSFYGLYETRPGKKTDFVKGFVAIDQEALGQGEADGLYTAWCLLDEPAKREQKAFEAAWNGYLRCLNLFQFLSRAFFATTQGKQSGQPYEKVLPKPEAPKPDSTDAWVEAKTLTDDALHGLLDQLAASGWIVPEAGFELATDSGEIIAEAELAWPEQKIALLYPEQMAFEKRFEGAGWRTFALADVLADPAAFLKGNHGIHEIHEKG